MPNDRRSVARIQRTVVLVTACVTAILAACSDAAAPAESTAAKQVDRAVISAKRIVEAIPGASVAQGLLRERPLSSTISVTTEISNLGGTVDLPEAGIQLVVPPNAFAEPSMTITVRALAGSMVAYDFEPHDATFLAPLRFVQKTGHTNWREVSLPPGFVPQSSGAYFPNTSLIDPATGVAVVSEFVPLVSVEGSGEISFDIWHFSGYLVSTGRIGN